MRQFIITICILLSGIHAYTQEAKEPESANLDSVSRRSVELDRAIIDSLFKVIQNCCPDSTIEKSSVNVPNSSNSDSITLKDLEVPTSPAFAILDIGATSIERPKTAKAFSINVINALVEAQGIPQNYAVEFTPFWFVKGKNRNVFNYYGYNEQKIQGNDDDVRLKSNPFANIAKTSISFALVNTADSLNQLPMNNMSLGLRTNILSFYGKNRRDTLYQSIKLINAKLDSLDKKLKDINIDLAFVTGKERDKLQKRKIEALDKYEKERNKIEKSMVSDLVVKPWLALDGAFAYSMAFDDNSFSNHRFGRLGTWLTLSLSRGLNTQQKKDNGYLNIYVLSRWLKDELKLDESGLPIEDSFFDFGGKLELEFKKFSLSVEHISRSANNDQRFSRTSSVFKYKINENLYLEGAFGDNFEETNDLISTLGIKWGLNSGNENMSIKN